MKTAQQKIYIINIKTFNMEEFKDYKFVWSFIDPEKHNVKKSKNLKIVKLIFYQ